MSDPADIQRLVGDLARVGTVLSVDLSAGTCRLQVGDIETCDLPWAVPLAGDFSVWAPPSVGEQRELLCPEGDLEAGIVGRALYSDDHPAPSDKPQQLLIRAPDGAILAYDAEAHLLEATLPEGATLRIAASGGVSIDASQGGLAIRGDVTVEGALTVSDDVVGRGVSLKNHRHREVQAGTALSGSPA